VGVTIPRRRGRQLLTKVSQIRAVRGLKDKRSSEIFAAITRWMEAGSVKRKKRGLYERVQQKPKKPA
jgi:hypothetical protein